MFRNQRILQSSLPLFVVVGLLLAGFAGVAKAQTQTKAPDRGFSPEKSYSVSDLETISLQSGNLMFNLPLGALPPGRGSAGGGINLSYNSKLWNSFDQTIDNGHNYYDSSRLITSDEGGWRYGYQYSLKLDGRLLGDQIGNCTAGNTESFYPNKLQLVTPDGGRHALYLAGYSDADGFMSLNPDGSKVCSADPNPPITGAVTFYTYDGTFLRLEIAPDSDGDWTNNAWTLYASDGSRVLHSPATGINQRAFDRNGNYTDITETAADAAYSNHRTTYLQDQFGRKVVIEYAAATDEDWVRSKGVGGVELVTRVKWKTIRVNKTYFVCQWAAAPRPSNADQNAAFDTQLRVVDQIYPPSPTGGSGTLKYEFGYDADQTAAADAGWGEVNSVTLPSGAAVNYAYAFDNVAHDGTDGGITAEKILRNRVTQKQQHFNLEDDGGTSAAPVETWTYTPNGTFNGLADPTDLTLTAPDGGQIKEYYTPQPGGGGPVYKSEGADGTVVERIYQNNNPPPSTGGSNQINSYVKYEFTSIRDGNLTAANSYRGDLVKTAIREYSEDKNGNQTEVKEYDFVPYSGVPRDASGQPTGLPSNAASYLKRSTATAYYNATPDAASNTFDADSYHLATSPRLLRLPQSMEVRNAAGVPQTRSEIAYDYTSYATNAKGGNPTESRSWDSTKQATLQAADANGYRLDAANSISTTVAYNAYGMPTLSTDAKGYQTQITYGSINGYPDLYPTQTIAAYGTTIARTSTMNYDFATGLPTSMTDADNNLTSATTYDALGRPLKIAAAVGTASEIWTQTEYDDLNRRVISRSDLYTKGDGKKVGTQFYDQLGRVRLTKTLEDATTQSATNETDGIKVQTRYLTGNPNSYQLTSNPYRAATSAAAGSESAMGWTQSKSVNTGKHAETETFAGAALPSAFGGNNTNSTGVVKTDSDADRTLVTDQTGKQRISKSNALGQLTDVWEITASDTATVSISFPNQTLSAGYWTSYVYDILNNLTTVNQGGQTRSFSYSSLSRLKSATNPEMGTSPTNGTIQYQYDNNGNLTLKTDARNVQTSYVYDALNRVTQRNYANEPSGQNATPNVSYTYDNLPHAKGKLTKVITGSVTTPSAITDYQTFDEVGRVTQSQQTTDGTAYGDPQIYKYNLSGALIEETYPSGRVVKNVLDADGDLTLVQSKKNGNAGVFNYAKSFTYTAAGAVSSMQMGNGKWESTVFNSRLQPTQIALGGTQNATNLLKLNFDYGTTANNGNVLSQTITVPSETRNNTTYAAFTDVQNYSYDALNRLKQADEKLVGYTQAQCDQNPGQCWKQTFTYDRFGNRNFDTANNNTTTLPLNCATAVCNPAVDPATNKLVGYVFDDAGNTKTDASGQTFIYDAENKQIQVSNTGGVVGQYYYDGDGKRVKKIVPGTGETTVFVYDASGKMVAEYSTVVSSTPQVSYLTSDHLGSPRINTDANGVVVSRHDYQPFGEEVARTSYGGDDVRKQFTAYERDNESGLDFAQARYYDKNLGRFNSVDPIYVTSERLVDPQRLNLFIYSRDNPVNFIDPTGKDVVLKEGLTEKQVKEIVNEVAKVYLASQGIYNFLKNEENDKSTKLILNVGSLSAKDAKGRITYGLTTLNGKDISITLDFERRDAQASKNVTESQQGQDNLTEPPGKTAMVKEEISHAIDARTNPEGYLKATQDDKNSVVNTEGDRENKPSEKRRIAIENSDVMRTQTSKNQVKNLDAAREQIMNIIDYKNYKFSKK